MCVVGEGFFSFVASGGEVGKEVGVSAESAIGRSGRFRGVGLVGEVAGGDGDASERAADDGAIEVAVGSVVVGALGHAWRGIEYAYGAFACIYA